MTPVQDGVQAVLRPIGSFLSGALHAGGIQQENAHLVARMGRLQQQASEDSAARDQLQTLLRLQQLPWVGSVPITTAQVVNENTSNFTATINLDKGSANGVQDGMPVVGNGGLVGQVIQTWRTGCIVRLITDAQSQVGVSMIPTNGTLPLAPDGAATTPASTSSTPTSTTTSTTAASASSTTTTTSPPPPVPLLPPVFGLAVGQGLGKTIQVQDVSPGTQLRRGEVITTSGLTGAQFPADIPVATISSFSSTASSLEENLIVAPVADLGNLQYVDVMLWEPVALPPS